MVRKAPVFAKDGESFGRNMRDIDNVVNGFLSTF